MKFETEYKISSDENAFENIIWKTSSILSMGAGLKAAITMPADVLAQNWWCLCYNISDWTILNSKMMSMQCEQPFVLYLSNLYISSSCHHLPFDMYQPPIRSWWALYMWGLWGPSHFLGKSPGVLKVGGCWWLSSLINLVNRKEVSYI